MLSYFISFIYQYHYTSFTLQLFQTMQNHQSESGIIYTYTIKFILSIYPTDDIKYRFIFRKSILNIINWNEISPNSLPNK